MKSKIIIKMQVKKKDENINISQNIWETLMINFLKNQ